MAAHIAGAPAIKLCPYHVPGRCMGSGLNVFYFSFKAGYYPFANDDENMATVFIDGDLLC
ncbi:hypothetical protein [Parapedobacter sp.]